MGGFLRFTCGILLAAALTDLARAPTARAIEEPVSRPSDDRLIYETGRLPLIALPDGERRQIRSVMNVRRPLQYGKFLWSDRGVPAGSVWVFVNLNQQTLSVFRDGHEIGSTVILYGADRKATPSGVFSVMEKAEKHRSTLYDAEMPYMLRLTGDGVAIHASDVRQGSATHGCIGVPVEFARLLYKNVRQGDVVAIVSSGEAVRGASS
jgi:hypothetical protein